VIIFFLGFSYVFYVIFIFISNDNLYKFKLHVTKSFFFTIVTSNCLSKQVIAFNITQELK